MKLYHGLDLHGVPFHAAGFCSPISGLDFVTCWILYSKQLFRIFMHKIYSKKMLKCLVGNLGNA